MKTLVRILPYWLPALLWLVVIALESMFLSSAVTGAWLWKLLRSLHIPMSWNTFSKFHHYLRKAGHVTGYGILCVLLFRACYATFRTRAEIQSRAPSASDGHSTFPTALLALGMTVITACLDEWHQAFDPSRTSSIRDVGLDTLGGIIFLSFSLLLVKMWRELPKRQMENAPL